MSVSGNVEAIVNKNMQMEEMQTTCMQKPDKALGGMKETLDNKIEDIAKMLGVNAFLCCLQHKYMSLCMRKPTIWVSDQVRHKPGCTVTE